MNNNNNIIDDEEEIDLLAILTALLRRINLIILATVIGAVATFSYSFFLIKPTYSSSTYIYVNNSNISLGSTSLSISSSDLSASQSLVDTYIVILKTRNTLDTVARKAKLNYSFKELNEMITASSVNNTEVFKVTVTSTDPSEACLIANTIADVFPDKVADIVTGTSAKIVDYAVVDNKPVAPHKTKYALFGAAAGFAIACALVILEYFMDDVVRDQEYLTSNYDIPVLAAIPNISKDNVKVNAGAYYKSYSNPYGSNSMKQLEKSKDDGKKVEK